MNGIRAGVPCAAAVACGMFTATFGGVVRDVLMHRPVRILHSYADIYATTALSGATVYMLAGGVCQSTVHSPQSTVHSRLCVIHNA